MKWTEHYSHYQRELLFSVHTLRVQCLGEGEGGGEEVEVTAQPCLPPPQAHQHRLRSLGGRPVFIKGV